MPRTRQTARIGKTELVQRGTSDIWTIAYYDPDARRIRYRSTKTTQRQRAEHALAQFVLERAGIAPQADAPKELQAAGMTSEQEAPSAAIAPITLSVLLDGYVTALREDGAPSTDQAAIAARHFVRILGAQRDPMTIDDAVLQSYVEVRAEEKVSAGTVDRELSVLRAAVNAAATGGYIAVPIKVAYVKNARRARDFWLTEDEVEKLAKAADTKRTIHLYLYIRLALTAAGRPEALLGLQWNQLKWLKDGRVIVHLLAEGEVQDNNKRKETVTIDDPHTVACLEAAFARRRSDYVIEWGGYPVDCIKTAFRRAVKKAGLPREVTPYVLRHSVATWMAQDGVPLWEIAGFLGHRDIRMVQKHYAHHHPDYQKKARASITRRMSALPASATLDHVPRTVDTAKHRKSAASNAAVQKGRNPSVSAGVSMVGAAGIEPATPTMST